MQKREAAVPTAFRHPYFRRGRIDLLAQVVRKTNVRAIQQQHEWAAAHVGEVESPPVTGRNLGAGADKAQSPPLNHQQAPLSAGITTRSAASGGAGGGVLTRGSFAGPPGLGSVSRAPHLDGHHRDGLDASYGNTYSNPFSRPLPSLTTASACGGGDDGTSANSSMMMGGVGAGDAGGLPLSGLMMMPLQSRQLYQQHQLHPRAGSLPVPPSIGFSPFHAPFQPPPHSHSNTTRPGPQMYGVADGMGMRMNSGTYYGSSIGAGGTMSKQHATAQDSPAGRDSNDGSSNGSVHSLASSNDSKRRRMHSAGLPDDLHATSERPDSGAGGDGWPTAAGGAGAGIGKGLARRAQTRLQVQIQSNGVTFTTLPDSHLAVGPGPGAPVATGSNDSSFDGSTSLSSPPTSLHSTNAGGGTRSITMASAAASSTQQMPNAGAGYSERVVHPQSGFSLGRQHPASAPKPGFRRNPAPQSNPMNLLHARDGAEPAASDDHTDHLDHRSTDLPPPGLPIPGFGQSTSGQHQSPYPHHHHQHLPIPPMQYQPQQYPPMFPGHFRGSAGPGGLGAAPSASLFSMFSPPAAGMGLDQAVIGNGQRANGSANQGPRPHQRHGTAASTASTVGGILASQLSGLAFGADPASTILEDHDGHGSSQYTPTNTSSGRSISSSSSAGFGLQVPAPPDLQPSTPVGSVVGSADAGPSPSGSAIESSIPIPDIADINHGNSNNNQAAIIRQLSFALNSLQAQLQNVAGERNTLRHLLATGAVRVPGSATDEAVGAALQPPFPAAGAAAAGAGAMPQPMPSPSSVPQKFAMPVSPATLPTQIAAADLGSPAGYEAAFGLQMHPASSHRGVGSMAPAAVLSLPQDGRAAAGSANGSTMASSATGGAGTDVTLAHRRSVSADKAGGGFGKLIVHEEGAAAAATHGGLERKHLQDPRGAGAQQGPLEVQHDGSQEDELPDHPESCTSASSVINAMRQEQEIRMCSGQMSGTEFVIARA